jgi:hypothetical protein
MKYHIGATGPDMYLNPDMDYTFYKRIHDKKLYELPVNLELPTIAMLIAVLRKRGHEDPEAAHAIEDELAKKFIEAIADGTLSGKTAVAVATQLAELSRCDFPRWCA